MLHQLIAYTETHLGQSEPGFKSRDVRWCLNLAGDGRLLNVLPLGDGKRGESLTRCPEMHGMNAGGKAHFLIETAQNALLLFKGNEDPNKIESTEQRHRFFVGLLREAAETAPRLAPLADLLEDPARLTQARELLADHKAKPGDWLCWRIGGVDPRLEDDVQGWWRAWRRTDLGNASADASNGRGTKPDAGDGMICFLTGNSVKPVPTHPKITGLAGVGGLAMGDVLVGFDKAAFGSYGLNQSTNAAMGEEAVQKYVDGLNHLVRNQSRKLANALVAHWFKESVPPEDDPFDIVIESREQTEAAALGAIRKLLDAIRSGQREDLGKNRYYAVTLSGAAGRVMIRDWVDGSFQDLAHHIEDWFSHLAIVHRGGRGLAQDPKFLAVCGALVRDLKDLPAPTASTLWRVAIHGLPIPRPMMAQALARFRADLVDKDQPATNHARMGLIRAYFVRLDPGGANTMTAYLNPDHPASAYHCGRLLAVLANLQRAALGDVGAGVVQRYYAAASQTPGLILGRLAANARNHLGKLEPGLAWWYESQIADVMSRLGDSAPRILDLEGQGLFALGYYQQLAALRAGSKTIETDPETTLDQGEPE